MQSTRRNPASTEWPALAIAAALLLGAAAMAWTAFLLFAGTSVIGWGTA